jgi:hypothetical protein
MSRLPFKKSDTMGERMGRIGRIRTDFFLSFRRNLLVAFGVSYGMTKKIRSYPPDPPNPFSHRISIFPNSAFFQNKKEQ